MDKTKSIPFLKMHGLGNDFIVLDSFTHQFEPTTQLVLEMANRRRGVGCDQLIVIEESSRADAFMRVYNSDGTEVGACGNASRCVADLVMRKFEKDNVKLETLGGIILGSRVDDDLVTVDMGRARTDWTEIPLSEERDTLHLEIGEGPFSNPVGVSMGNPHAVFFVDNVETALIAIYGPMLETNPIFSDRANIEFAEVKDRMTIRMRVWERGSGVTEACGTGACATAVAAIRRGLTDRKVRIIMDGGELDIEWRESDGHVLMTGGFTYAFEGKYLLI